MELIQITRENLACEHICCAIANEKDRQVMAKKAWLKDRLDDGLVFLKGNVRGKCFIEYLPAEAAWVPVNAPGYFYIDCLWVSGQFKGHGYSSLLLEACIRDAKEKGRKGLTIVSSQKKQGFLADPKYLRHKGFLLADTAAPHFELMFLPFAEGEEKPCFRPHVKEKPCVPQEGIVLYYTSQCPFTVKYVPLLQEIAERHGIAFDAVHLLTKEQAQSAPCSFTTFSLFYQGKFITHEILSEKKFEKLLDSLEE